MKMKKFFAAISLALVLAMTATCVLPAATITAEAAKVKISKTKASVMVGKTITLKISGTDKTVKWSSDNKKVAIVTSKGKVKGIAPGEAVITAKVGGKEYDCFVTVKFDEKTAKKNLSIKYEQCNKYTVAIVKNNNKYSVALSGYMFYDKKDQGYSASAELLNLQPGKSCALVFLNPTGVDGEYKKPSNYKVDWDVAEANQTTGLIKNIKCESELIENEVKLTFTNKGDKSISYIPYTCLFYSKKGKLLTVATGFANCNEAGSTWKTDVYHLLDSSKVAKCKVYVNGAYNFN